jgi:hypothetical protein
MLLFLRELSLTPLVFSYQHQFHALEILCVNSWWRQNVIWVIFRQFLIFCMYDTSLLSLFSITTSLRYDHSIKIQDTMVSMKLMLIWKKQYIRFTDSDYTLWYLRFTDSDYTLWYLRFTASDHPLWYLRFTTSDYPLW